MDMGPCPRAHQEKLQEEFKQHKAANPDDPVVQRIEAEWQSNIFGFVDDCDRKINASQRRLEKTPEENAKTTALVSRPSTLACTQASLSSQSNWNHVTDLLASSVPVLFR